MSRCLALKATVGTREYVSTPIHVFQSVLALSWNFGLAALKNAPSERSVSPTAADFLVAAFRFSSAALGGTSPSPDGQTQEAVKDRTQLLLVRGGACRRTAERRL